MADVFTTNWDGERHKGARMGTLWTSKDYPDGDITLSPEFMSRDRVTQLDMLKDWIGLLERHYDAVLEDRPYR